MEVERIPVSGVRVGLGRRHVDAARVTELTASIQSMGLRTPITVRIVPEMVDDDGVVCEDVPILVAGAHRLEAARSLGWDYIDAFVMEGDETDARLWEIAENLHRSELTVQERAVQIAEWVRLMDGRVSRQVVGKVGRPEGGSAAASRELGVNEREVQRAVKIASITDEAKEAARVAGLDDNQSALLKVAAAEPEAQTDLVHWLADQKAERRGKRETNAAYDKMTKEDASERLAEMLSEFIPGEQWATLTALLYAAGDAKAVAKAFNRLNGAPVFDQTIAGRAA
jgi:ParB family chromosome partitioning protein